MRMEKNNHCSNGNNKDLFFSWLSNHDNAEMTLAVLLSLLSFNKRESEGRQIRSLLNTFFSFTCVFFLKKEVSRSC